jgi:hypothetical protein
MQVLLYAGVGIVLALTLAGCSRKQEATPTPEVSVSATPAQEMGITLATIDPTTIGATDQNLGTAREVMAKWKGTTNFELYHLAIDFGQDLTVGEAVETYTFSSPEDPGSWWNVTISQRDGSVVRTTIPREDYLTGEQLEPIDPKYWQTNWVKAFQIAEAAGGAQFRAQNTDVEVTAKLGTGTSRGWLWWVIEYSAPDGTAKQFRLNPADGALADELGSPLEGNASTSTPPTSSSTVVATPTSAFPQ